MSSTRSNARFAMRLAAASLSLASACRGAGSGSEEQRIYLVTRKVESGSISFPVRSFAVDSLTGSLADVHAAVNLGGEVQSTSFPMMPHPSAPFLIVHGRQELRLLRIEDSGDLTLVPKKETPFPFATFVDGTFLLSPKRNLFYFLLPGSGGVATGPGSASIPTGMFVARVGDGESAPFFEKLATTHSTGCDGFAAALDPSEQLLFCSADSGKAVKVLDAADYTGAFGLVSEQRASERVRRIVTHPGGALFYTLSGAPIPLRTDWDQAWISGFRKTTVGGRLTPATRAYVPLNSWIVDIAVTPDGRFLYALDRKMHRVHGFIIGTEGELVPMPGFFRTSPVPVLLRADPMGRFLYVGSEGGADLAVYTIGTSGELIPVGSPIPVDGVPISLAFRGGRATD